MTNLKYRKYLLSKYAHLYKRDFTIDQEKCIYCNSPSVCFDHRPAISNIPNMDINEYLKNGGRFNLLPACNDCNKYLNNKIFYDVLDCQLYLKDRYEKKIKNMPCWTDSEISELSYSLQQLILNSKSKRDYILYKINGISEKIKENLF